MIRQLLLLLVVLIVGHPQGVTANTYLYDASTKHLSSNSFELISQQSNYENNLPFYRPVDSFHSCCSDENVFSGAYLVFVSDFLVTNSGANFTYRGDSRSPDEVFSNGFQSRGNSTDLQAHALDNTRPPSAYVSTSRSADVAGDFADNVYVVRPRNGIDVNQVLGSRSPFPDELEIAIPGGVSPSDIRAVTRGNISILNPGYKP